MGLEVQLQLPELRQQLLLQEDVMDLPVVPPNSLSMESQTVVAHHDLRGRQFALGLKPENAAVIIEYGSKGLVVINSKLVPNWVIFAAHQLWPVGQENYVRLIPSFYSYVTRTEPIFNLIIQSTRNDHALLY